MYSRRNRKGILKTYYRQKYTEMNFYYTPLLCDTCKLNYLKYDSIITFSI